MSGSSSVASGKSPVGKLPNDEGTVTGANELKRFKGVLTLPFKHKEVDPFLEPVDWQGLGLVVTHPMDLPSASGKDGGNDRASSTACSSAHMLLLLRLLMRMCSCCRCSCKPA